MARIIFDICGLLCPLGWAMPLQLTPDEVVYIAGYSADKTQHVISGDPLKRQSNDFTRCTGATIPESCLPAALSHSL